MHAPAIDLYIRLIFPYPQLSWVYFFFNYFPIRDPCESISRPIIYFSIVCFFFQFSCFCCWFWRLLACIHFPLPSVASTGPKLQPKTWPCACTRFTFIDQINCRAPTLANQTNSVCLSVSQMICYPLTHQCGVTAAVAAVVAAVAADHAGFHEIYGMFYGAPICISADI